MILKRGDLLDSGTISVLTFIQSVGAAEEVLNGLSRWLTARLGLGKVNSYASFPAGVTINYWDEDQKRRLVGVSLGVSAVLPDGTDLDWSLDISCDAQGWLVERAVYRRGPDEDSPNTEVEFPEWQGASLEEMAAYLPNAVMELRNSVERPGLLLTRQQADAPV